MKICIITNYIDRGYVNELLILDNLISTLNLQQKDIYPISDINLSYSVNKNYTHVLVLLDFKITSLLTLTPFLDNISIPKIFIIDTIPEIHKGIDTDILNHYKFKSDSSYNSLSKYSQNTLYNDYADALIFYSNLFDPLLSCCWGRQHFYTQGASGPDGSLELKLHPRNAGAEQIAKYHMQGYPDSYMERGSKWPKINSPLNRVLPPRFRTLLVLNSHVGISTHFYDRSQFHISQGLILPQELI